MKVKFIYWEAAWNLMQKHHGEKYPHFGLLLGTNEDICTVLYFTHEKQMVLTGISKKENEPVELVEVEIPYEIYESAGKYIEMRRKLKEFADTFLSFVDQHRDLVDKADDALADADTTKPPEEKLLDRFMSDDIVQPFPRRPRKKT